jgi:hypothetical protein
MKPETAAGFPEPLALFLEIIWIDMRQGFFDFFHRIWPGDQHIVNEARQLVETCYDLDIIAKQLLQIYAELVE